MSLEIQARWHQTAYAASVPQTLYGLISFMPDARLARLPLDLRVVLDASGSMADVAHPGRRGSKLELLRDAVTGMIDTLQPGDHLQLVRFDHDASTIYDATLRGEADRKAAKKALAALRPNGGTSIVKGLAEAVSEAPLPDHVARLVLVTDGEGLTEEEADCERLAFDARGGATWLVYGTGVGYNDAFLDRLARANGGQYVHLSDMRQAIAGFEAEAALMGEVALTGLVVTLEPMAGVELARVDRVVPQLTPMPVHMPAFFGADLGDVDKARGQKLLVQMSLPPLAIGSQPILRVKCGFHVPALKLLDQQREVVLSASFDDAAGTPDAEVLRTVQLAGASRLYTLGLAEAADGRNDAAVRTLGSAAGLYDQLGLAETGQMLVTLTTSLQRGAMDEETKRTLTTIARRMPGGDDAGLP